MNSNGIILDCESYQSTLVSVEKIIGVDRNEIETRLKKENYDWKYECFVDDLEASLNCEDNYPTFGEYIVSDLAPQIDMGMKPIDTIMWFHLTRTLNPELFKKGILPLGEIHDDLFDNIYECVSNKITKNEWDYQLYNSGEWMYKFKLASDVHYGPFAMLVRDVAFTSEQIGNYDYLSIPEIVRDAALSLNKIFNIDLKKIYQEHSQSVIVKFCSPPVYSELYYVGIAVNYLYHHIKEKPLTLWCNTCFDAKNIKIEPRDIVKIEVI